MHGINHHEAGSRFEVDAADDIPAFNEKMIEEFARGAQSRETQHAEGRGAPAYL